MPNGECTTSRQSPSSSRNRSTTSCWSWGTALVASRCCSISATRLSAAQGSSPAAVARAIASSRGIAATSRVNCPMAAPSSAGRPEGVAGPEGQPARLPGSGGDEDAVVGDVLDPPAGGAEGEDVADPGLVDHLLVELADPAAAAPFSPDQEDAEKAAVGDGAAAGHGQALGTGAPGQLAGDAVPDQSRAELGELVARVAPGEQVEGRVIGAARERRERRGPAYDVEELVDVPGVEGGGGDHLLREYVERAGRHVQRLDAAGAHPFDGDRRRHQVAAVLGEQHPARDLADVVAGAADALQGARDRRGRLDLDDQVDRTHVDAELEAAGRDHAGQPAALEVVLDDRPLLLGHRAVVGPGDERCGSLGLAGLRHHLGGGAVPDLRALLDPGSFGSQLVEPGRQPLGQAAGVGEDDRRLVLLDQVEHAFLDVRPQRTAAWTVLTFLAELGHVLDGDDDLEVPLLLRRRCHHLDRRRPAEEARDLVDRADRGGEPDPLRRLLQQLVEPLEGHGQVRAALGAGDGVHLVDDHGLDASQ